MDDLVTQKLRADLDEATKQHMPAMVVTTDYLRATLDRITELETALAEAKTWRDAVDNALVTDLLATADSFPDAATAVARLLEWTVTVAVDPAVSKPAADLVAEAEGRVKWVFPKSIADMPAKPGKAAYEYVECLILRKGEMLCRPWNCEHQVFDDEAQDDFFCQWNEVTAYMDLTAIRDMKDRT